MRYFVSIFFWVFLLCIYTWVNAHFRIVEVLPNTIDDAQLEYITLQNICDTPWDIQDYILSDKLKDYHIADSLIIQPGERVTFPRTQTKLVLNNTDEELFVTNPQGEVVDQVSYSTSEKWEPLVFSQDSWEDCWVSSSETSVELEIVEVLPNTVDDAELEYIVIQNFSSEPYDLQHHILSDKLKDYVITDSKIILPGETLVFPRTETKLVLNNTDEELFLQNPQGEIIHQVAYEDSEKWVPIFFHKSTDEWEQESWETYEDNQEDDNSWEEEIQEDPEQEDEGQWEESEEIIVQEDTQETPESLEVQISLQNPSYIFEVSENTYHCDKDKEVCKVNFDMRDSFSEDFPEKDYECKIDFWVLWYSEESQKCNPNKIEIPIGEFEIYFQIFYEESSQQVWDRKILIIHTQEEGNTDNQEKEQDTDESIQEGHHDDEDSQQENEEDTEVNQEIDEQEDGYQWEESEEVSREEEAQEKPESLEVQVSLQIPSYIFEVSENVYHCDGEKDICKINFDMRDSFSEDFPEKDYECEINFWVLWYSEESQKCNPNTIELPVGEFEIYFQIFHEENRQQVGEKRMRIINTLEVRNTVKPQIPKIHILHPKIQVQSGVSGKGRYFHCEKNSCKMNLKYEKRHDSERCFWHWGHSGALLSDHYTSHRCNPGAVSIPLWTHDMSLKVYEDDHESNRKRTKFYVYNILEEDIVDEQDTGEEETDDLLIVKQYTSSTSLPMPLSGSISFEERKDVSIQLQGKLSSTKSLQRNSLRCFDTEKCHVNFNSNMRGDGEDLEYFWIYDGEIFSYEKNPKAFWMQWTGKHKVYFYLVKNAKVLWKSQFIVDIISEKKDALLSSAPEISSSYKQVKQTTTSQDRSYWKTLSPESPKKIQIVVHPQKKQQDLDHQISTKMVWVYVIVIAAIFFIGLYFFVSLLIVFFSQRFLTESYMIHFLTRQKVVLLIG